MTTSDNNRSFRYEGNGVTAAFSFPARIFSVNDLVVEIITRATDALVETLTITTDYTVVINSEESATVTTVAGKIPSATQDIQIRSALAQTQTVDLPTGTVFPAKSVEDALDRVTVIVQEISEDVDRAIKLSPQSSLSNVTLPDPSASALIGWNAGATDLRNYTLASLAASSIDTSLTGLADNDLLQYNSTSGFWENVSSISGSQISAGTITSTQLGTNIVNGTHIALGSDAQGDIMYYDGTNYARLGAGTSGQYLKTNGAGANPSWSNIAVSSLASGTDGELITWDASGNPATVAVGTSGQVLTSNGAGAAPTFQTLVTSAITNGAAVATTSGTTANLATGLSGVTQIAVNLNNVSENSGNNVIIQIGDSGGFETTGYSSAARNAAGTSGTITSGFVVARAMAAGRAVKGTIFLNLVDSANNTWVASGVTGLDDNTEEFSCFGTKSLSGELTQVRVATISGTFDAGSANANYQ